MSNQKGFMLPSGLSLYGAIAVVGVITVLSLSTYIQTLRLGKAKADYAAFVAEAKAAGAAQDAKAKATIAAQAAILKETNIENANLHSQLDATAKRLRASADRSIVPATPASSRRPDLACFDRAGLDRALRDFNENVGELIIEGQSCTVDLDTGKAWVKEIGKP